MTSVESDGAAMRSAPANSHRAGARSNRATRLNAAAIEGADRQLKVHLLKSGDDFHALQSPGTTAPVTGSVPSGVE
jgi:hypothetical protein